MDGNRDKISRYLLGMLLSAVAYFATDTLAEIKHRLSAIEKLTEAQQVFAAGIAQSYGETKDLVHKIDDIQRSRSNRIGAVESEMASVKMEVKYCCISKNSR